MKTKLFQAYERKGVRGIWFAYERFTHIMPNGIDTSPGTREINIYRPMCNGRWLRWLWYCLV